MSNSKFMFAGQATRSSWFANSLEKRRCLQRPRLPQKMRDSIVKRAPVVRSVIKYNAFGLDFETYSFKDLLL